MDKQRADEIYEQVLVKGDIARRHTQRLSPAGVEAATAAGLDASAERVIWDVVEEAYDAGQRDASLAIAHSKPKGTAPRQAVSNARLRMLSYVMCWWLGLISLLLWGSWLAVGAWVGGSIVGALWSRMQTLMDVPTVLKVRTPASGASAGR